MAEPEEDPCWERQLRKQLLLLATVVVSFTYAARINPPGGVWQENGPGYNAGDMVLLSSHRGRYLAFCYCNSTALTASVVVIFLLLLKKPRRGAQLVLLRVVMLLDLLGLVGAYAAGSNRDDESTRHVIYSGSAIILHVVLQVFLSFHLSSPPPEQEQEEEEELDDRTPLKPKEWRKVLMLLATFTMASTYMAGLSSSGGHWDRIDSSNSKQGHDAFVGLDHKAKVRFKAFFYCNTTAFIASLFLVLHLLSHNIVALALSWLLPLHRTLATGIQCVVLYVLVLAVLLGLLGAYAAGNCPDTYTIVFVLCLFYCNTVSFVATMALNLFVVSPNLYRQRAVRYCTLYVCIVVALLGLMAASSAGIVQTYAYVFVLHAVLVSIIAIRTIGSRSFLLKEEEQEEDDEGSSGLVGPATIPRPRPRPRPRSRFRLRSAQETKDRQEYTSHKHLMLLGILAASATYQAGFKLKHPRGLWQEDDGSSRESEGNLVTVLFYINSTSFVTSIFVVALQLLWRHQPMQSKLLVLSTNTALVLDMLGLMAAYACGAAIHENENALIIMVLLCMPVHAALWILGVLIKCIKRVCSVVAAIR